MMERRLAEEEQAANLQDELLGDSSPGSPSPRRQRPVDGRQFGCVSAEAVAVSRSDCRDHRGLTPSRCRFALLLT